MSRSLAFEFLCGCLARDLADDRRQAVRKIALSKDFSWEAFAKLAGGSSVAPAVPGAARRNGFDDLLPPEVASFLEGMTTLNCLRNEAIRAEALELTALLNRRNVVPVLLKGGANLLSGLYPGSGDRVMVDLDLLVSEALLIDCALEMTRHGYEIVYDNGYPASHHYPPMARPGAVATIELHTRPIADPHTKLLSSDETFATASKTSVGQATFALPSAPVRIMHSVIHTQLTNHDYLYGRLSLRELWDFALLCESAGSQLNWHQIRERFVSGGGVTALDYQVLAARRLLGAQIPAELPIGRLARILYSIAVWQIRFPGLLAFRIRLLRPWVLLRRSLSNALLRRKLLGDLVDPVWYRRHWQYLKDIRTREP